MVRRRRREKDAILDGLIGAGIGAMNFKLSENARRQAEEADLRKEQRLAAIRAAERAAKNPGAELPASQVGTRRFARGRAYVADRYDVTEAEAAAETAEAAVLAQALACPEVAPYLAGKEIKKQIYIPKRMVNLVVAG